MCVCERVNSTRALNMAYINAVQHILKDAAHMCHSIFSGCIKMTLVSA
jgi:hypothetical protein